MFSTLKYPLAETAYTDQHCLQYIAPLPPWSLGTYLIFGVGFLPDGG